LAKPALEYFSVEQVPWSEHKGSIAGLTQKILSRDPDNGIITRILHFAPGTDMSVAGEIVHDFWEECYILDGYLHEIDTGRRLEAGNYCCRPPGMPHGRWTIPEGCTVLEIRYPGPPKSTGV
jgi:hypothetical protein